MQPANTSRTASPPVDAPAATSQSMLLVTKLVPPPVRAGVLPRPRLADLLQRGIQRPVTLIAAPAGFGKTTLLADWLQHAPLPTAWLTLDQDDNDLIRFWSYVFTAVSRLQPGSSALASALLPVPAFSPPPPIESILTAWINVLATLPHEIALVLDDYHVITTQPIHRSVTYLLDHLPHQLHLVISTRADPPLPLTRLRARGQLTEIRVADLRLTTAETAAFLTHELALSLSQDDIAALEARTEGWIAGLQLAALSLREHDDIAGFLKSFTGSHHYIIDYLMEEVLARQPEPVQTFLLHTAILETLQGPLCDAVLGTPTGVSGEASGQLMLEQLAQANLFLMPLDDERRWYRYHQLFAETLRHRLRLKQPALLPELHRRASEWYERHDLLREAVHHALAAYDYAQAARLIERAAERLAKRGELGTLRAWMEALPAELVQSHMELGLWYGWLLTQLGSFDTAEQLLQTLDRRLRRRPANPTSPASPPHPAMDSLANPPRRGRSLRSQRLTEYAGRVAATRAYIAFRRGDAMRTITLARQALDQIKEDQTIRGLVAWYLGIALMWHSDMAAGAAALADANRISQAAGNHYVACMAAYELAQTQARQGQLHQADESYQQALVSAAAPDESESAAGPIHVGSGDLQREWNHLDAAAQSLREGIARCQQMGNPAILLQGYIALVRVRQAQGDAAEAAALIQQIAAHLRTSSFAPINAAQVAAWHARLALAQGDIATATRWVQERQVRPDDAPNPAREIEHHTLARVLLAQQQPAVALPLLARLVDLAERQGRMGNMLEHLVLQAIAQRACADEAGALAALARALSLAEPEGYIRLFVDEGAPMAWLLARLRTHARDEPPAVGGYRDHLLALLGDTNDEGASRSALSPLAPDVRPLDEPLGERELAVLRLIAAGCSNREIADQLVIAVSTVKWYINAIYAKLQVASRTKAVARARQLHLVD